MTATVMSHDSVSALEEEHQLRIPVVGTKGPAVVKNNGLSAAPILVKDLGTVFRGDIWHEIFSPRSPD
jgi:hypothetical protein